MQSLGRAPSPYRQRAIARAIANDNSPVRSLGRPANFNQRSPYRLPRAIARDIPREALRRAVPRSLARRALMTSARLGLRVLPYVGMALLLFDVLSLLYEALRRTRWLAGSEFKGYVLKCTRGPAKYLYGGGGNCGFGGYWDWASMKSSDATGRANVGLGYPSSFDVYQHVPGQNIGPYERFVNNESWEKSAGAPGRVKLYPNAGSSLSLDRMLDDLTLVDAGLSQQIRNFIQPATPNMPAPRPFGNPSFEIALNAMPTPSISVRDLPAKFPKSRPPRRPEKEKKFAGKKAFVVKLFRALDQISEKAEIVDILFKSLDCATIRKYENEQKRIKRANPGYYRSLTDNAGQYGVDGADWKLPAVIRHYNEIDWPWALEAIALNEIEDKAIGLLNMGVKSAYSGPTNPVTEKAGKKVAKLFQMPDRCG